MLGADAQALEAGILQQLSQGEAEAEVDGEEEAGGSSVSVPGQVMDCMRWAPHTLYTIVPRLNSRE